MIRQGTLPDKTASFRHGVTVTVPSGTFVTEEVRGENGTLWVDTASGVTVKMTGDLVRQIFGYGPVGDARATAELTKTNVPMTAASSPVHDTAMYALAVVGTALLLAAIAYALARTSKSRAWHPTPTHGGSDYASQPAPPPAVHTSKQQPRSQPPLPNVPLGAQAAPAPTRPAAPVTLEALDKLAKLKPLVDTGLITREESEREKARLLGAN